MMKRFSAVVAFVFVVAFALAASAQEARKVSGGVLNGKATSLPKPAYPDAAKAAHAEGMIGVDVEIDENGVVVSAKGDPYDQRKRANADGTVADPILADPSLVQAAEEAALRATFSPTKLAGQPVRVSGRIVYNFVSSSDSVLDGPPAPPTAKTVTGGVLNGKASSLPQPVYPVAAMAVNAQGTVTVQLIIDESGNVITAAAVAGHPLLRGAAEEAAKGAKFSPTFLSGTPVKVSGVVTYNFVLAKKGDQ